MPDRAGRVHLACCGSFLFLGTPLTKLVVPETGSHGTALTIGFSVALVTVGLGLAGLCVLQTVVGMGAKQQLSWLRSQHYVCTAMLLALCGMAIHPPLQRGLLFNSAALPYVHAALVCLLQPSFIHRLVWSGVLASVHAIMVGRQAIHDLWLQPAGAMHSDVTDDLIAGLLGIAALLCSPLLLSVVQPMITGLLDSNTGSTKRIIHDRKAEDSNISTTVRQLATSEVSSDWHLDTGTSEPVVSTPTDMTELIPTNSEISQPGDECNEASKADVNCKGNTLVCSPAQACMLLRLLDILSWLIISMALMSHYLSQSMVSTQSYITSHAALSSQGGGDPETSAAADSNSAISQQATAGPMCLMSCLAVACSCVVLLMWESCMGLCIGKAVVGHQVSSSAMALALVGKTSLLLLAPHGAPSLLLLICVSLLISGLGMGCTGSTHICAASLSICVPTLLMAAFTQDATPHSQGLAFASAVLLPLAAYGGWSGWGKLAQQARTAALPAAMTQPEAASQSDPAIPITIVQDHVLSMAKAQLQANNKRSPSKEPPSVSSSLSSEDVVVAHVQHSPYPLQRKKSNRLVPDIDAAARPGASKSQAGLPRIVPQKAEKTPVYVSKPTISSPRSVPLPQVHGAIKPLQRAQSSCSTLQPILSSVSDEQSDGSVNFLAPGVDGAAQGLSTNPPTGRTSLSRRSKELSKPSSAQHGARTAVSAAQLPNNTSGVQRHISVPLPDRQHAVSMSGRAAGISDDGSSKQYAVESSMQALVNGAQAYANLLMQAQSRRSFGDMPATGYMSASAPLAKLSHWDTLQSQTQQHLQLAAESIALQQGLIVLGNENKGVPESPFSSAVQRQQQPQNWSAEQPPPQLGIPYSGRQRLVLQNAMPALGQQAVTQQQQPVQQQSGVNALRMFVDQAAFKANIISAGPQTTPVPAVPGWQPRSDDSITMGYGGSGVLHTGSLRDSNRMQRRFHVSGARSMGHYPSRSALTGIPGLIPEAPTEETDTEQASSTGDDSSMNPSTNPPPMYCRRGPYSRRQSGSSFDTNISSSAGLRPVGGWVHGRSSESDSAPMPAPVASRGGIVSTRSSGAASRHSALASIPEGSAYDGNKIPGQVWITPATVATGILPPSRSTSSASSGSNRVPSYGQMQFPLNDNGLLPVSSTVATGSAAQVAARSSLYTPHSASSSQEFQTYIKDPSNSLTTAAARHPGPQSFHGMELRKGMDVTGNIWQVLTPVSADGSVGGSNSQQAFTGAARTDDDDSNNITAQMRSSAGSGIAEQVDAHQQSSGPIPRGMSTGSNDRLGSSGEASSKPASSVSVGDRQPATVATAGLPAARPAAVRSADSPGQLFNAVDLLVQFVNQTEREGNSKELSRRTGPVVRSAELPKQLFNATDLLEHVRNRE